MAQLGQEKKSEATESHANPKVSSIQEARDTAKDAASDLFRRGQEIANDVADKAKEYTADATEEVSTMLRKYPMQSLLVGFGLGCLVGVLVGRK